MRNAISTYSVLSFGADVPGFTSGRNLGTVNRLQMELLRVYTRAKDAAAIESFLSILGWFVPVENAEVVGDAHRAVAEANFAAEKWKQSHDSYSSAGDCYMRYGSKSAAECYYNAALASVRGSRFDNARKALESFVKASPAVPSAVDEICEREAIALVRRNPLIRPENFDILEARHR